MEVKPKAEAGAQETKSTAEEVKRILAECDQLHQQAKFEESLQLANSGKANNAPTELLPYVLEMQVRNMYHLMMYQSALKLLEQILKYMPLVKDFQFRKIQCELALAKTDEARTGLENMKKSIAEEFDERQKKGDTISQQDHQWKQKVDSLLAHLATRKNRDLNKIRVYFKEITGDKLLNQENS